ncbi:MAG: nuclear transport factor 2 family protein [Thermoanaerobaculia bacterium]
MQTAFNCTTRSAAAVLLVLVTSLSGCSTSAEPSDAAGTAPVAALTRQADQWDRDIVRKDHAAIAANMTSDFRQIRSNGTVVDREVFLRDITDPDLVIDPYTVEDFDVRIYGDVALLCGRTRMTGRYAGEAFTSHYRYIDIYVRRDGQWKVCSVQTTAIPESPHD